ncbi:hydroxyphenylacetyl-CoA thioesterase PaaI [Roseospira navarrensis]|uniref:Hydroxyphenylacetyl-CoA thioesterase PaaI n=1 Tax=Roseospira navarrensis TaxID=140058 RepID=A0A7X1ZFZ7_9PROT|nr:hydroxyphenylacetyl-CoA thioesterase PaaI [Roseospira navarrensis]MQX36707.1 hydroxyphenylacetyl-CoA thioesterase PaaI [Roseospira navarrensis]
MDQTARQAMAEATTRAMYPRDNTARHMGIVVEETRPGYARATMEVRDFMVNGHDILHGGVCFTLADTAFAYCCNSHDVVTVASACSISFIAPGKLGDRLTAEAVEVVRKGRAGITDVTVTNQTGEVLAVFRGNSRTLSGRVTEGEEPPL